MKTNRFIKIYKQGGTALGNNYLEIWMDQETGVQYLYRMSGYSGGLTPLLDRDGKPLIASAEERTQAWEKS